MCMRLLICVAQPIGQTARRQRELFLQTLRDIAAGNFFPRFFQFFPRFFSLATHQQHTSKTQRHCGWQQSCAVFLFFRELFLQPRHVFSKTFLVSQYMCSFQCRALYTKTLVSIHICSVVYVLLLECSICAPFRVQHYVLKHQCRYTCVASVLLKCC